MRLSGTSLDDRQRKKLFKRKMLVDKTFLQKWSGEN